MPQNQESDARLEQLKILFFEEDPNLVPNESQFLTSLSQDQFQKLLELFYRGDKEGIDRLFSNNTELNSIWKKYVEKIKENAAKLDKELTSQACKSDPSMYAEKLLEHMQRYKSIFGRSVSDSVIPIYVNDELIKKWIMNSLEFIVNNPQNRQQIPKTIWMIFNLCVNDKRFRKLLYTDVELVEKIARIHNQLFQIDYDKYRMRNFKKIEAYASEQKEVKSGLSIKLDLDARENRKLQIAQFFDKNDRFNKLTNKLLFNDLLDDCSEFYNFSVFQTEKCKNAVFKLLENGYDYENLKHMLRAFIIDNVDSELSAIDAFKSARQDFLSDEINNKLVKLKVIESNALMENVETLKSTAKNWFFGDANNLRDFNESCLKLFRFHLQKIDNVNESKKYNERLYGYIYLMIRNIENDQFTKYLNGIFSSLIFNDRIGNGQLFLDGFNHFLQQNKLISLTEENENVRKNVIKNIAALKEKMLKKSADDMQKNYNHPYLQSNEKEKKSQFQMQQQQQQQQQVQMQNVFKEKKPIEFDLMPECVADKTTNEWTRWFGSGSIGVEVSNAAFDQLKKYMHLASLGINLDNLPMGFYKGICGDRSFIDYDQKQVDILRKTPLTMQLTEKPTFDFTIAEQYKDPFSHLGGEFEKDDKLKNITLSNLLDGNDDDHLKDILNKMLRADDRELAEQIKFDILFGVDPHINRVKSAVILCYTHGALGVKLLQDQLEKLKDKGCNLDVVRALFLKSVADWGNEFMNSRFVDAVNGVAKFNKNELLWWNELVKQHFAGSKIGNLPELYNAFTFFCENYKSITGLADLPDKCSLKSVGHMQVGLDRLLKIVLHAPEPAKVDLSRIDLTIDDYHRVASAFKPVEKPPEKKEPESLVDLPKRPLVFERKGELKNQFDTSRVDDVIATMKDLSVANPTHFDDSRKRKLGIALQLVNQVGLFGKYGNDLLYDVPVCNMDNNRLKDEIAKIRDEVKKLIASSPADKKAIQKNQLIYLALAREALCRADEQHRFANSTQMIAVINEILGNPGNSFAQIETGQGKSLTTALMASMLLLESKAVEICTSDAHLAKEGLREFSSFYQFMGIPVSAHAISATSDAKDYQRDGINYSDVASLAIFHDRMKLENGKDFFGGKISGIIDEADYIVDLQTTMRLTTDSLKKPSDGKGQQSLSDNVLIWGLYPILNEFIDTPGFVNPPITEQGKRAELIKMAKDYVLQHVDGNCRDAVNEFLADQDKSDRVFDKWLHAAVRAKNAFLGEAAGNIIVESVEVAEGQYQSKAFHVINNVKQEQAQLKDGGQQFLHARLHKKYQLEIDNGLRPPFIFEPEVATVTSTISKSLVKFYQGTGGRLKGTTGTLGDAEDRADLVATFGVSLTGYPTHQLKQRIDRTQILNDQAAIDAEVMREIKHRIRKSDTPQPMLIVCKDSAEAKRLYDFVFKEMSQSSSLIGKSKLRLSTVPYKRLNGKEESPDENKVIADAAQSGFITITDESLSRGKDFKPKHDEGLFVMQTYLGTEKGAEQVKGRAGRQGNVGESLQLVNSHDLIPGSPDATLNSVLSKTRSMHARSSRKMRKFDEFYADMDAYFTDKFLDAYSSAPDDKKSVVLDQFIDFRETMEALWTEVCNKRLNERNTDAETVAALRSCKEEFISTIYDQWKVSDLAKAEYHADMDVRFPGIVSLVQPAPKVQDEGLLFDEIVSKTNVSSRHVNWGVLAEQQWQAKLQHFATDLRSDHYPSLDRYLAKLREIHLNTKEELVQSGGEMRRNISTSAAYSYLNDKMDYFAFAIDSARGTLLLVEESNLNDDSKLELRYLITQKLKMLQQKLTALDIRHDTVMDEARLLHKYFHRDLASLLKEHRLGDGIEKILDEMHEKSIDLFSLDRDREGLSKENLQKNSLYNPEKITKKTHKTTTIRPIQIVYEKPLESLLKADEKLNSDFSEMLSHLSKTDGVIAKIQVELLKAFSKVSGDPSNDLEPLISLMINGIDALQRMLSDDELYRLAKLDDIKFLLADDDLDNQEQVKNIDTAYRSMIDLLERMPLSQQNRYLSSQFRVYDLSVKSYKYPLATISSLSEDKPVLKSPVEEKSPKEDDSQKTKFSIRSFFSRLVRKKSVDKLPASTQKSDSSTSLMKNLLKKSSSVKKNKLSIAVLDESIHQVLTDEPIKKAVEEIKPDYVYEVEATKNLAKDAVYVDKVLDSADDQKEYEIYTLKLPTKQDDEAYLSLAYIQIKQFMEEMKKLNRDDFTIYVREDTCSEMVNAYRLIAAANGLKLVNETNIDGILDQDQLSSAIKQYGNLNTDDEFKERCLWQQQVLDDLDHIKELKVGAGTDEATLQTIDKRLEQRLQQFHTFFRTPLLVDKDDRFQNTRERLEQVKKEVSPVKLSGG